MDAGAKEPSHRTAGCGRPLERMPKLTPDGESGKRRGDSGWGRVRFRGQRHIEHSGKQQNPGWLKEGERRGEEGRRGERERVRGRRKTVTRFPVDK